MPIVPISALRDEIFDERTRSCRNALTLLGYWA